MIELLFAAALVAAVPVGAGIAAGLLGTTRPTRRWLTGLLLITAGIAAAALFLPRGPGPALLATPWWCVTVALAVAAARSLVSGMGAERPVGGWPVGVLAANGFLVVGATWTLIDRAGLEPFGFGRTIVLLTAVHFHVAGFVLTLAGTLAARERPGRGIGVAVAGLVAGIPLTALGFFGFPLVSWAGALVVAAGGIAIGATTIAIGHRTHDGPARACLLVGGASLLLTMPLAAAYATGTTFGIPFLDIPAMAAIHGGLNVVGFAIPVTAGWRRTLR